MPHAGPMPSPGLQALILCGPGSSFPTFTANPDEHPKALLPVANRPMLWYPLDFCYRCGITNITIICPPSAQATIISALNTHPVLTSLPLPRPTVLAPSGLTYNSGTAEIFRLPQVKAVITSDFIVLPCDLVCALPGHEILRSWMVASASIRANQAKEATQPYSGSGGGLSVWYNTKSSPVKGEETDFCMTAPLTFKSTSSGATLVHRMHNLVYSIPTSSLKDHVQENNGLVLRHSLLSRHARTCSLFAHRDAHIYIFPKWVLEFINRNEFMESIGEDVVGWWAKAGWQAGLSSALHMDEVLGRSNSDKSSDGEDGMTVADMESSLHSLLPVPDTTTLTSSRCPEKAQGPRVPPMLAYIHPPEDDVHIIRRVDTSQLLLQVSLKLAKLAALDEDQDGGEPSPFAHIRKIAYPAGIQERTTITQKDCLLAENVTVEEKTTIKETVVGSNCQIKQGSRLLQCLLMDGVVVRKNCRLTRCIIGKRAVIGEGSTLTDVEVQENLMVEAKTDDKNNRLMSSKGLEAVDGSDDSDSANF